MTTGDDVLSQAPETVDFDSEYQPPYEGGVESSDDDDDDDDDENAAMFESVRSSTGLEIGCLVRWPRSGTVAVAWDPTTTTNLGNCYALELTTCLPPESMAPMFDGTQWAGTRVWRAAVVALQYLLLQPPQFDEDNAGSGLPNICHRGVTTTVLELGCGLGVPGMILHAAKHCRTVLTDKDDLVVQLRQNIAANFGDSQTMIQAQPLDWSVTGVRDLLKAVNLDGCGFDICLNCDCIYEPLYGESWKLLLEVQEELLRVNPDAYVLTAVERRRVDGVDDYLKAAAACKSVIARVEQLSIPFPHAPAVELYRIYGTGRT